MESTFISKFNKVPLGDVCAEVQDEATEKEKQDSGGKLAKFLAFMLGAGYFARLLDASFTV
jgi:hypothetical protein